MCNVSVWYNISIYRDLSKRNSKPIELYVHARVIFVRVSFLPLVTYIYFIFNFSTAYAYGESRKYFLETYTCTKGLVPRDTSIIMTISINYQEITIDFKRWSYQVFILVRKNRTFSFVRLPDNFPRYRWSRLYFIDDIQLRTNPSIDYRWTRNRCKYCI